MVLTNQAPMAAKPYQEKLPDDWGEQNMVSESEDDDTGILSPGCSKSQGTAVQAHTKQQTHLDRTQEFILNSNRYSKLAASLKSMSSCPQRFHIL